MSASYDAFRPAASPKDPMKYVGSYVERIQATAQRLYEIGVKLTGLRFFVPGPSNGGAVKIETAAGPVEAVSDPWTVKDVEALWVCECGHPFPEDQQIAYAQHFAQCRVAARIPKQDAAPPMLERRRDGHIYFDGVRLTAKPMPVAECWGVRLEPVAAARLRRETNEPAECPIEQMMREHMDRHEHAVVFPIDAGFAVRESRTNYSTPGYNGIATVNPVTRAGQKMCSCGHPRVDHDMWGSGPCLTCSCAAMRDPALLSQAVTRAGRLDTVLDLAKRGEISAVEASALAEAPSVGEYHVPHDLAWACRQLGLPEPDHVWTLDVTDPIGAMTLTPSNPLDVKHDGVPLRDLLMFDEINRREYPTVLDRKVHGCNFTPAQRAAVSAHWSAELRAKVAASTAADREREQRRVLVDLEDE